MKRGIVFACGGTLGYVWSLLALRRYERANGWDARDAAALVGTSAGSILATAIGARVSTDDLLAQLRTAIRDEPTTRALPPPPHARWPSLSLLARGLRRDVPAHVALSGLIPEGRGESASLCDVVGYAAPTDGWVGHPACLVVALDVATGERIAFGRAPAPATSAYEAVRASCAIPGWMAPVTIAGRRCLDGGVASPTSLDLLAGDALDEILVFSPMTSQRPAPATTLGERFERVMRRHMTRTLDAEVEAVERAGTRVVRFEPTGHELALLGANFMDPRRRALVVEAWAA